MRRRNRWKHTGGGCGVGPLGCRPMPCDDAYRNTKTGERATFQTTTERHFDMPRTARSLTEIERLPGTKRLRNRSRNKPFPSSIHRMATAGGYAQVSQARENWLAELNDKVLQYTPSSLESIDVYGIVLTFDELGDQDLARAALIHRMSQTGMPLRLPHHSVSLKGLLGEAEQAKGGMLVLEPFSEFSERQLDDLWREIPTMFGGSRANRLTIIGLDSFFADHDKLAANADALRLAVLDPDGDPMWDAQAPQAPPPASTDLEVVNRHRASLGMTPLDPAAGWTAEEIAAMAESIRTTGIMANPRTPNVAGSPTVNRLRRRLLR